MKTQESKDSETKHRSESLRTLTAKTLRTLIQDEELEGYTLAPHFLVKIFAIAEKNGDLKIFFIPKKGEQGFYELRREQRLEIIKHPRFFNLLKPEEKDALYGTYRTSFVETLQEIFDQRIDFIDLDFIRECAYRCKALQDVLDKAGAVTDESISACVGELRKVYKKIRSDPDFEYNLYKNYVESNFIANESAHGTCLAIVRNDIEPYKQTPDEQAKVGHWKLHINIDMEKNSQETIDAAYDIVLQAAKKHKIYQLKMLMPMRNLKSMEGRELTVYLHRQDPETKAQVLAFMREVEAGFNTIKVIPRENTIAANKPIGRYFQFRNARGPDGKYISAANAAELAVKLKSEQPHNPLGYEDVFELGKADLSIEGELAERLTMVDKAAAKDAETKAAADKGRSATYTPLEQQQAQKDNPAAAPASSSEKPPTGSPKSGK